MLIVVLLIKTTIAEGIVFVKPLSMKTCDLTTGALCGRIGGIILRRIVSHSKPSAFGFEDSIPQTGAKPPGCDTDRSESRLD